MFDNCSPRHGRSTEGTGSLSVCLLSYVHLGTGPEATSEADNHEPLSEPDRLYQTNFTTQAWYDSLILALPPIVAQLETQMTRWTSLYADRMHRRAWI